MEQTHTFAGSRHTLPFPDISAAGARRAFFAVLALVTALPVFGLGFGLGLARPAQPHSAQLMLGLAPVILATSLGHVLSTSFIYLDRGFGALIGKNRQWFIVWPALAIAISGICFALGPVAYGVMYAGYYAWQMWHFQRQNYGVISFAAQIRKFGPLPKALNAVLDLGTVAGILAILSRDRFFNWHPLWWAALVPMAASTILLIRLLITERRFSADAPVMLFSGRAWAFHVPTLLSPDPLVAFLSYGIAHGFQYLVFMVVMARGSAMRALGPIVLAAVTCVLVLAFSRLSATPAGAAIYTGVIMAHFVIDAKLWRMREPMQRGLIKQRFAFVFG
jgi:hypothetical protein